MAINPDSINTVSVGQLPETPFNLTDLLAHEVGSSLNRGTVQNLADLISGYIGASASIAFRPETVSDGGILPNTSTEEWMLVGQGTFTNVGGGADITTTEELNALISNGVYWSIGVEIPINVDLAGITQLIRSGFTNTTPSEDAVFNALSTKVDAADVVDPGRLLNINGDVKDLSSNREWRTSQADTGVLTFAGLTTNSSTTINIGAVKGYVIDNETDPLIPVTVYVDYAGETNKTVTTVGTGTSSYVMLSSTGSISFQNTFPTSAERKSKIWLGKVGHPLGVITTVINEPDYITSPMAFSRDVLQALGGFINKGVYPSANGANLNINVSAGVILGDGVNFVSNRTNPNEISFAGSSVQAFMYRTQTGAGGGSVTAITPGFYDNSGTITAIGGGSGASTIQYVFYIPGQGFIIQYGQTVYTSFPDALAAVGRESFTVFPNLVNNAIPVAAIVLNKSATALNNTAQAVILRADKLGSFIGATAGTTIGSLGTSTIVTGTTYTVLASDLNKMIICTNSSAVTITIPLSLPIGFRCRFYQQGTGTVSFVVASGGTLRYQSYELPQTEAQYSIVGMEGITNMTDTYKLFGQLSSI